MNATVDPIGAYRLELRDAALRRIRARRRRGLALVAALALGVLVSGFAIAGTGWLVGEPAAQPVVQDFRAYTPQLGFHPEPGKAVFVAEDGPVKLYATTNREGTYCLVVDEPWKHADAGDGGSCVPKANAAQPITAGIVGASAVAADNTVTYVIAGRVDSPQAKTLRFTDPAGDTIERPIGSSGFYVAALHGRLPFPVVRAGKGLTCPAADWNPRFVALDSDGNLVRQAQILLVHVDERHCTAGSQVTPHGP
jgi:hypothetical protein